MPPKAKFTKEEIITAALKLVREKGIEALTARSLAQQLSSSAQPIFTVFKNMEEVQEGVKKESREVFNGYIRKALSYTPAFKQMGIMMIRFATEEPKLFQLLFMWERPQDAAYDTPVRQLGELMDLYLEEACIAMLQKEYDLNEEEVHALFEQVWIFTFGIGLLCATHTCRFTEAELEELLGREFLSMLMYIKAGRLREKTPHPTQND